MIFFEKNNRYFFLMGFLSFFLFGIKGDNIFFVFGWIKWGNFGCGGLLGFFKKDIYLGLIIIVFNG